MRGQRASPVRRKADGQGQKRTSPAVDPIRREDAVLPEQSGARFLPSGGSSLGAVQASRGDHGVQVRIAVNHWRKAVETHATNFQDTDHDCADISQVHPSRYPRTSILIASPECVNYSRAKGKKRKNLHERDLWGNRTLSVEEERSRVRMFDPIYFAEHHKYDFVIIENVVDVRLWVLYDAWLKAWVDLGYEYKELFWNSMFFHPTPQSRDRLYVVLWRKGMPAPDLEYRPLGWCARCEKNVEAVQSWKNPTKKAGKWGKRNQYVYRCPLCAEEVTPYYYCAWNCIDWSIPTIRIGDREAHKLKPLVERTLERIQVGLKKFAHQPAIVDFVHSGGAAWMVHGVSDPMPTQLSNRTLGISVPPFLINQARTHGHNNRSYALDGPIPTQTGTREYSLIVPPFLASLNHSDIRLRELSEPMPTAMPYTRPSLVVPPFVVELRGGGSNARSLDEPLATVTAKGRHHALALPFVSSYYGQGGAHTLDEALPTVTSKDKHSLVVPPFLLSYYGGRDALAQFDQPVPTVPTANRHAVVEPGETIRVEDCSFRMFKVPEIQKAMAFPDDYVLLGNQDEQVKMLGNAVTPPPMERMIAACLDVYGRMGRS
jgi:DNA (cytosine-5)-methyltransferase 1